MVKILSWKMTIQEVVRSEFWLCGCLVGQAGSASLCLRKLDAVRRSELQLKSVRPGQVCKHLQESLQASGLSHHRL